MELEFLDYVVCGVGALVLGSLLRFIYRGMNPPCNRRLPPGSMGLPIVGETIQFLKPSPSWDIPEFYKLRLKRYGPLFKTSLVGQPVVISMDMEVNRFIFRQEDKLFQLWYPDTVNSLLGKKIMTTCYGALHKYLRGITAPHFAPKKLKEVFMGEMERTITESLRTWASKPSIEVKEAMTNMMFDLMAKNLISLGTTCPETTELKKNFAMFSQGLISFPLYFPGTKFYKSMQGRKYVHKVLKDTLKERMRAPEKRYGDFLDIFVAEMQSGDALVDENLVVDLIVILIFASIVATATTLTVAMKFLTDNPNVVAALTEEHEAILKKREDMTSCITWEEFKSMKFTSQVINEISRLSSVAPGIFKKTLADVQINGYTIPSGWLVMMSPMAVHLNPENFKDPLTFNPWRWQESNAGSPMKNFIPFGDGTRYCIGAEFTKLQIALFIHMLVTKYRWKEIKGGDMFRISDVVFPQGYHVQLLPRT